MNAKTEWIKMTDRREHPETRTDATNPTPALVPTPRTDYIEHRQFGAADTTQHDFQVALELARTLERELIDAKELLQYCAKEKSQLFAELVTTKAALAEAVKDGSRMLQLLEIIQRGLESGAVKAKPFIVRDPDSEQWPTVYLEDEVRETLDAARAEREGGGHE